MKTNRNQNVVIAFKKNNNDYLKKVHLFLNKMYYQLVYCQNESDLLDKNKIARLKIMETAWFESEKNQCLSKYSCDQEINDKTIVETMLKRHPVYKHELFDYLCHDANLNDLKKFLINESVLNLEFFDYLAMSIIGVSDSAKAEIAGNLWDEAGRGDVQKFHTTLFSKLLKQLDIEYNRNNILTKMSWEGVAGINLFNYLSIYQTNKMKYFGLLAATEMLDPPHYLKLIRGLKRILNKSDIDISYYSEHATLDIQHSDGWLNKVILPELKLDPHKNQDFWEGFYLRLDSAQRYYDNLYNHFLKIKAA